MLQILWRRSPCCPSASSEDTVACEESPPNDQTLTRFSCASAWNVVKGNPLRAAQRTGLSQPPGVASRPAPFPMCGAEETRDSLACSSHPPCL